jgi:glutamate-1-semialdehyde aminotransferase
MTRAEVRSAEDAREADQELFEVLRLGMVNRGMNWTSRGIGVTAAMTSEHVEEIISAFQATLVAMRPLIEEASPELLA